MRADLCLVLHAHLPFVRHLGDGVYLEENWLPEAVLECYVPLLMALDRLERDGVPGGLSCTVSPTLAAMLADQVLRERVGARLSLLAELAEKEQARHADDPALRPVTAHYATRFAAVRDYWAAAGGDLLARFRHHQAAGRLDLLACAATHALLPILANPRAVERQIAVGVRAHAAAFGEAPRGIWLPECAWFPGAGEALRRHGVAYTVLAAHAFLYASPRPGAGVYAPIATPEGVTAFGRDPECSQQVWSATEGYPGDGVYREFYRDLGWDGDAEYLRPYLRAPGLRHDLGLKYHRVTGRCALEHKEYYVPALAAARAREHARDFLQKRAAQAERLAAALGRPPVLVAPYDAELFGHWWYEGPLFLEELLRAAAEKGSPARCRRLADMPTTHAQMASPAVSSWGDRGYFSTWLNGANDWIYPPLYAAQGRLDALEDRARGEAPGGLDDGLAARLLRQATRELLLAQASDWPFIITNGTMADYARRRVESHLANFDWLAGLRESGAAPAAEDAARLAALEAEDNLFSAAVLDWREGETR